MSGTSSEAHDDVRETAEAVARRSYGKLVAFLASRTGDVAQAEDALSEAFAAALRDWPLKGCPSNPEAWLLTVARRKSIDAGRRRRHGEVAIEQMQFLAEGLEIAEQAEIPDRRLALMFAAAHPAIEPGIHAPLILQAVLGLNAKAIASAFLTAPATMGKRLVRAKEKIRQARIAFVVPERDAFPERLGSVLDAIYACFSEGWTDPGGTDPARRDLTGEALYLARLVTELMPQEAEPLGLLALMLHAEARRPARRNPAGDFVPLDDQEMTLWDTGMIAEAEGLLRKAGALIAKAPAAIGRYQLEAALQSAHVHRRLTGRANWRDVVQLYDALLTLTQSPVVAINRALAIAERDGANAGLDALPEPAAGARLAEYQPYWATRADLLARCGVYDEARRAYEIAIGLERDEAVRRFLRRRQQAIGRARSR